MSGIFDMFLAIFCLFWILSAFKAFNGVKPEKKAENKGSFLEKAAVGLIGKDIFEEIRREMKQQHTGKDKILNPKPLKYKNECEPQKEKADSIQPFENEETEEIKKVVLDNKKNQKPREPNLSLKSIKRGIIMAEILGPPKSKRAFGNNNPDWKYNSQR